MKRIRLPFSSRLARGEGPGWEPLILDQDTNATYAHQAGFMYHLPGADLVPLLLLRQVHLPVLLGRA